MVSLNFIISFIFISNFIVRRYFKKKSQKNLGNLISKFYGKPWFPIKTYFFFLKKSKFTKQLLDNKS